MMAAVRDTGQQERRAAGLREHRPRGEPAIMDYPDDDNPDAPVTMVAMCACGSSYCKFIWTAYFPLHVREA